MLRHGVAYVPEDRHRQGLCPSLSVRANTVLSALRQLASLRIWVFRSNETDRTQSVIHQLKITARSIEQPVITLSGGNQQKVLLGRWLECAPDILILDEPTKGVDIATKAEIHALTQRLAGDGKAIILISSDLPEIMAQSHRLGVFRAGRLVTIVTPWETSTEQVAAAAIPAGHSGTGSMSAPRTGAPRSLKARMEQRGANGAFRETGVLIVLLGLSVFLQWRTGEFLQWENLRNLLTDAALLSFCAIGASVVIVAGGLDISLAALMALSAALAGRFWEQQLPMPFVVAVAMSVGAVGGMVNAGLSLAGRVHPLVITLGTMSLYRGLTLAWLEQDVQIAGEARNWIFAEMLGLPVVAWSGLALVVSCWLVLGWTLPGRKLYAVGSNPGAARRAGVNRAAVWITAFTIEGMLTGLAGLLYLARSGSLQATSYEDKTLEVIAAVVLGGVAITGGRGSVWGVAFGCLFMVSLGPLCVFLGISPYWQRTLVGGVLIVAVLWDSVWRRRSP
jgi:ribose/xylose/arabinose/galactoside ABC-type transport system permease subunit/ABC-type Mn2+/Zn2+ transport system ATPase subunit